MFSPSGDKQLKPWEPSTDRKICQISPNTSRGINPAKNLITAAVPLALLEALIYLKGRLWIQTLPLLTAPPALNQLNLGTTPKNPNQAQQLVPGFSSPRDTLWFLKGTKSEFSSSRSSFSQRPSSYIEIPAATFQVGAACLSLLSRYLGGYNVCLLRSLLLLLGLIPQKNSRDSSGHSRSWRTSWILLPIGSLTHLGVGGGTII